jgi:exodeoxyribonuclease V alpha subunit
MIRGIGPVYATRACFWRQGVRRHRGNAGPAARGRWHRAGSRCQHLAAWAEQKAVREIMVFLHSHGVGTARAVRIFKTYSADARGLMDSTRPDSKNHIPGIGIISITSTVAPGMVRCGLLAKKAAAASCDSACTIE